MKIHYGIRETPLGSLIGGMSDKGIAALIIFNKVTDRRAQKLLGEHFPKAELKRDDRAIIPITDWFDAYWRGDPSANALPELDLIGTDFRTRVWRELLRIPYGETCSYADVAAGIGHATATRAVGSAVGANPIAIMVPCHRVTPKSGGIGGFRLGSAMKQKLLEHEARFSQSSQLCFG